MKKFIFLFIGLAFAVNAYSQTTLPKPAMPTIEEWIDYGFFSYIGVFYSMDYDGNDWIPLAVDGSYLDPAKTTYSVFTDDDQLFEFTHEEYPDDFDETVTEIPFGYEGMEFGLWEVHFPEHTNEAEGVDRFFNWRIGLRLNYRDGDQVSYSDIYYMEVYPQLQEAKNVTSTSFFADWSCNADNTYMINNFLGNDCGYFLYVVDKDTQETVLVQNVEPTNPQTEINEQGESVGVDFPIPGATYTVEGLIPGKTYQYYVVVKQNTGKSYQSVVREVTLPENNVYMLGGDDQGWDCTQGTQFAYDAENEVYTATITFPAEVNYFGFTTMLAENNDDGGWAYIEPFRFGAISDEGTDYWYTGDEDYISLTWDAYHAIRIPGGEYKLTVDLKEMKLYIENEEEPQGLRGDVNDDKVVDITDATMLINFLLSGDATDINMVNANCDLQGTVDISDATTLINFLLNGTWPD